MRNSSTCPACGTKLVPTPLLYPTDKKDYASDPFISTQWNAVRDFIDRAMIITVFGYIAPTTDKDAMEIFTNSWKNGEAAKYIERIEIIDIRDTEQLARQWSSLAHFDHYDIRRSFF